MIGYDEIQSSLKYPIQELLNEQVPHWPLLTTLKNNLAPFLKQEFLQRFCKNKYPIWCNNVNFIFWERCIPVLVLFVQEQIVISKSCPRQRKRNIKYGDCYDDFTKGWKKWWQKFLLQVESLKANLWEVLCPRYHVKLEYYWHSWLD